LVTRTGLVPGDAAQRDFAYRFGWGRAGLASLADGVDVVIVVDILRFTSAVSAAVERGAEVLPYPWGDDGANAYAADHGAVLAGRREEGPISLSPTDLLQLEPGRRIVLPSPDGSTLAFEARNRATVLAGSFRNAAATADRARQLGTSVAVIAAGEHWPDHGGLRPCVEDLLGAGAILTALDPSASLAPPGCSPEAAAAQAAFMAAKPLLPTTLAAAAAGRELARIGFADDVDTASQVDVSSVAAELVDHVFVGRPIRSARMT
jgi:2-phosphosulfolactate phosphatase